MKKLLAILALSLAAVSVKAQLIHDFNSTAGWTGSGTVVGGSGVVLFSGTATDLFALTVAPEADFSAVAISNVNLTGFTNVGNTSAYVNVTFYDSGFGVIASADFALTSINSTVTSALSGPLSTPVAFIAIQGDGNNANALNVTLGNLEFTPIPEPSHVALGLGAVALLGAGYLRRRKV